MRTIVHGGAGEAPDEPGPRQGELDAAAEAGAAAATPLDAVCVAVRRLESSPRFNAGVGGARQSDGAVRVDAGLMTSDRSVGAVAGVPGVEHAVSLARVVAEETPHVLVVGPPAVDLAEAFGVETGVDLTTEKSRERWADADVPAGGPREHVPWLSERLSGTDTVGAVAGDGETFAAATSTGGRWFALAGRVGDVPQGGSGFYCAPAGGASATGEGEDIVRVTLCRRAVDHVENGADAQTAADRALAEFEGTTGSRAGLVVADDDGVGAASNTEAMQTSVAGR